MKRQLKGWLLLGCAFWMACFSLGLEDAAADGQPVIHIPESTYMFPTGIEGAEIHHAFVVANKGTAELKILKVRTG